MKYLNKYEIVSIPKGVCYFIGLEIPKDIDKKKDFVSFLGGFVVQGQGREDIERVFGYIRSGKIPVNGGRFSTDTGINVEIKRGNIKVVYTSGNWSTDDGVKNIIETLDPRSALLLAYSTRTGKRELTVGSQVRNSNKKYQFWQSVVYEYIATVLEKVDSVIYTGVNLGFTKYGEVV